MTATTPGVEQGLTSTFTATADAWIDSHVANSNAGFAMLEVRAGPSNRQMTLLRFNTAAIQAAIGTRTVKSASLQLNIASVNTATFSSQFLVNALSTSSWTEMGATYKCGTDINTADNVTKCATGTSWNFDSSPPYGATSASTTINTNATGWASFNVLPILSAGITNGWIVRHIGAIGSTGATFFPREAPNAPRLVLTFAPVCGDATKESPEQCDDGNTTAGDGCSSTCTLETWSNEVVVAGEVDAGLGDVVGLARDSGRLYALLGPPRNAIVELLGNGQTRLVAGNGTETSDATAHMASGGLDDPLALTARDGTLYVAEGDGHRVLAFAPDGSMTVVAGTGINGFSGDGGPATAAQVSRVTDLAFGPDGSLYLADPINNRVRRVSPTGIITTVAGNGTSGSSGDGGLATNAAVRPDVLAIESNGGIIIGGGNRLRRIAPDGVITSVAGDGTFRNTGDGGPAIAARIIGPTSIAIASDGALHLSSSNLIRRIESGTITTVGGTSFFPTSGDGGPATAAQLAPGRLVLGPEGLTFSNDDGRASTLRRIDSAGIVTTVVTKVGTSFAGDGGAAVSAVLAAPDSAVELADGSVIIADSRNHRLRRVGTDGTITTVAGDGVADQTGDGGPASAARVAFPRAIIRDAAGNITFVDDRGQIRRISNGGLISTVTSSGDFIESIALASSGTLYFATDHFIVRVEPNGAHQVIAGTQATGVAGDGGAATAAQFLDITAIVVTPDGTLLVADGVRIRKVVVGGNITTIAGAAQQPGFSGDGGQATAARFKRIESLSFLPNGNLLLSDPINLRLRQIASDGVVTTFAGGGSPDHLDDGKPQAGGLSISSRASATTSGGAIVTTTSRNIVRRFNSAGVATSLAGAIDPLGSGPLPVSAVHGVAAIAKRSTTSAFVAAGSRIMRIDTIANQIDVVAGYRNNRVTGEPSARFASLLDTASGVAIVNGDLVIATRTEQRLVDLNAGSPTTWPISTTRPLLTSQASRSLASVGTTTWWTTSSCVLSAPLTGGTVTTVAGSCTTPGFVNGTATAARFNQPEGIAVLADGTVYVSDTRNHRVRRIRGGTVTTITGTGTDNNTGAEGSVASAASISLPRQLAVDSAGHLYIAAGDAVRMIADDDGDGVVDGGDRIYTIYDGGRCLRALALMDNDRLWVADACDGSIVELER